MRIINQSYLMRGEALLDFAFDKSGSSYEIAEYIGMICGYLSKGLPVKDMKNVLSDALSPGIGAKASEIFSLLEDWDGRGLWSLGPAENDVTLTDLKLRRLYPLIGPAFADDTLKAMAASRPY